MSAAKPFKFEHLNTEAHVLSAAALEGAATHAVRHIALNQLRHANEAAVAWARGEGAEALHDFRVALRRLVSTMRAYETRYAGHPDASTRRRLKRLHARTNAARDLEVFIAFASATWGSTHGAATLLKRLAQRGAKNTPLSALKVTTAYGATAEKLERQLAVFTERHDLRAMPDSLRGRDVIAQAVGQLGQELEKHMDDLRALPCSEDTRSERLDLAHDVRIQAKRLRYIAEPVVELEPAAKALVSVCKALQSTLGDLQDAATAEPWIAWLKARTTKPGQEALVDQLAKANQARVDECLAALDDALRSSKTPQHDVHNTVQALVSALSARAASTDDTVPAQATPSQIEIERKYLLKHLPDEVRAHPRFEIAQGWLPGNELRERLRRTTRDGDVQCFRTIKMGRGIRRLELEERCEESLFDKLWPLTEGCRVVKTRYKVPAGELTIEVDDFEDRALVLAEVELEREDQAVSLPEWLTRVIVREVTEESQYVNLNLAK